MSTEWRPQLAVGSAKGQHCVRSPVDLRLNRLYPQPYSMV